MYVGDTMKLHLPAFLSRVAIEYDALQHLPDEPIVRASYDALCDALAPQFALLAAQVQIRFTAVDPYPTSAAMFADLERGRLSVYTVADLPTVHPLRRVHSATAQPYNVIFRAVHDGLAHFPERNQFGPIGEFRAFKAHCRMLAGNVRAMHALATETLGQNAIYQRDKTFAEQKADLLPWSIVRQALTEVSA